MINKALRPKTVPLRSIQLREIDEFNPKHSFDCQCEMCRTYEHRKITQLIHEQEKQTKNRLDRDLHSDKNIVVNHYNWILRHLMLPHNKIITKGLDLLIPQVIFYKDGEANELYCTKQIQDPTIKRMNKQKINNPIIQKLFNDRRRKYKEFLKNKKGKKKIEQKKALYGDKKEVKKDFKTAVMIRFNDGCQILQTQTEFVSLLLRRKLDPIWKEISMIKNAVQFLGDVKKVQLVYVHGEHLYQQLFKRSQILVKVYGQYIQKGQKNYIAEKQQDQFCKEVMNKSYQIYAQYMLYKIVNFINFFYDERINKIDATFIINQRDQIILDKVLSLEIKELVKFEWTNQTYTKKINEEEHRVFYAKKIQVNEEIEEKAKDIENHMENIYETMKNYYGLSIQEEDNQEEKANNKFFCDLYPNFKYEISEVLKDPSMTVNKFKRQYLGYKPVKKPIFKPFNANMVNALHKMTPKLHRADPHQFISTPRRNTSSEGTRRKSLARTRLSSYANTQILKLP